MPIYLILKRYWLPLLLLLVVIASLGTIKWYGASQYSKGVTSATATMQSKLNKVIADKEIQARQASKNYQELKTKREAEQGIQYVEIEKIIREPVYLNDCIDDAGVSAINNAANSK